MGNRILLFDTSIFVDQLRTDRHRERIASVSGRIRHSSVVLAELLRGAKKQAERDFVETLGKHSPLLTPSEKNWLESGRLLTRMNPKRAHCHVGRNKNDGMVGSTVSRRHPARRASPPGRNW